MATADKTTKEGPVSHLINRGIDWSAIDAIVELQKAQDDQTFDLIHGVGASLSEWAWDHFDELATPGGVSISFRKGDARYSGPTLPAGKKLVVTMSLEDDHIDYIDGGPQDQESRGNA
jgi:hypothetical protein